MSKKILIVGGGIAGLTLASCLERNGIIADVVEVAGSERHAGYGITVMPHGLKVLDQLGLTPKLQELGCEIKLCEFMDEYGKVLNSVDLSSSGIKSLTLDRNDLLKVLESSLKDSKIDRNTTVTNLKYLGNKVYVEFSKGNETAYDLVIGCDGINSSIRSYIFPTYKPHKVGAGVWMSNIPNFEEISSRTSSRMIIGPRRFMAIFPYKGRAAVAYTTALKQSVNPNHVDISTEFSGMSEESDAILKNLDKQLIYAGHLRQVKLPRWYKGRVILAGDAAHAALPTTAQGASLAIQDAETLANLIATINTDKFDEVGRLFQQKRKKSVVRAQRNAYMIGRLMVGKNDYGLLRQRTISILPGKALVSIIRNGAN